MQRVVRSTLVGVLAIAGLTACGDKVTLPAPTTSTPPTVVHQVTVSPSSLTLTLPGTGPSGKGILAASVDADQGVSNRGVTWTSGNTAVATVGTDGTVTAVGAGTTTVTAASIADPTVKGAASVTVLASGGGGTPIVSIASTNTTVCDAFGGCNSVPANLQNFGTAALVGGTGILDVVANVDANGGTLSKVTGTLTCGGKSITAQGGLGTANTAPTAAEGTAVPISLQFNTTQLDSAGNPLLFNTGAFNAANPNVPPCTLTISAQNAGQTPVTATNLNVVLDNADVATVTMSRSGQTASDAAGFPWVSGDITVNVKPALYSQRTAANVQVTLPNANGATEFKPASSTGTTAFTWTNNANDANNVAQLTLTGGNDVNGNPVGVVPLVSIIDSQGNDIPNIGIKIPPTQSAFRIDNQSPQPPLTFQIPQGMGEWVNGQYVFFSSSSSVPAAANAKYIACGDAPAAPLTVPPAANPQPGCVANSGVSRATANSPIAPGGQNPNSTLRIFAFDTQAPGVTVPAPLTNGTSTSTTTCTAATDPTKGWIDVTTNAGALTEGPTNTRYIIRAVETDKLGNIRCTDLATTNNTINNNALFARATIGSDKTPPTVPNGRLLNPSENAGAAGDLQAIGCPTQPPLNAPGVNCVPAPVLPSFMFSAVDNLSGFSATPVSTKLTRFDQTGTAVCVIGTGSSCNPVAKPLSPVVVDNGTNVDGYYTYTASISDLAGNVTTLPSRTVLVDRQAPVEGGIQVPATLTGGAQASFQTNATDNLDLVSSDFTLAYPITPANSGAPVAIRTPGPSLGAAFDNVLTTTSSFSFNVPSFVRSMASTSAAGVPQNNAVLPNQITGRVYDAASNQSAPVSAAIQAANIPLNGTGVTPLTNYTNLQVNGATFSTFQVSNGPANVSNCAPSVCATPANPTTVVLTATATGTEQAGPPAFQFQNPFPGGVSFYYYDPTTTEWTLVPGGVVPAPSVSDNSGATVRTFTWTSGAFDPPLSLGNGTVLAVIAVGVNSAGDALVSAANGNINLTNP